VGPAIYLSVFFLSLSLLFSSSFLGNTMQLMLKLNRSPLGFEVLSIQQIRV
jgi:hypothetical protein